MLGDLYSSVRVHMRAVDGCKTQCIAHAPLHYCHKHAAAGLRGTSTFRTRGRALEHRPNSRHVTSAMYVELHRTRQGCTVSSIVSPFGLGYHDCRLISSAWRQARPCVCHHARVRRHCRRAPPCCGPYPSAPPRPNPAMRPCGGGAMRPAKRGGTFNMTLDFWRQ